ncbi:tubby-like protein [Plasmopara halstedii]|uniref:Tubby-like protein n=1 Tax=Plasmopara halstedii TaxID=4781 RepID=A0A0P1AMX7_PLAHL|nr:tubby-like protein [Plasmopara halstedii]CEG42801.1 tubby-like protein [Plasmopara halstedii]|eukprot:XP_024579170.1 tubby-like protein [Plasmopara halstedii]
MDTAMAATIIPTPNLSSPNNSFGPTEARAAPISASRFAQRRLRVVTVPKHSNKMHRTRTLSELILLSPRSSPRVTPRHKRFDMDIEVSSFFAEGEGLVDLMASSRNLRRQSERHSIIDEEATTSETQFFPFSSNQHEQMDVDEAEPELEPEMEMDETHHSVGEVVDMLFEIHSALKSRHLGQRTAASALAVSNLVSTLAYPTLEPIPRDEQLEALENTRKMLECAICQEVFTNATEATCCGQIFCKDCIERWVSERGSCPMCREAIGFSLLAPSRHAQRMANEMKVTCPYCSESMKKASLSDHIVVCDQAPVEPPPPADVALRQLLIRTARLNSAMLAHFLMTPSPPQSLMMQCYIRTRGGGNYELYTQDSDTLLCTAVRRRQYDMSVSFIISLATNLDLSTNQSEDGGYPLNAPIPVARLDKNYMGSQYTMYDIRGEVPLELGAVQYAATFGKSPRQMRVALPLVAPLENVDSAVDGTPSWMVQPWRPESKEDTILAQVENPDTARALHLINKPPVWIESLEAYCLDFGGRVAAASVKNFLLSHPDDMDKTLMLFGRTQDRQVYSMDYAHPFTPVQAFAIALSSMDSHLVTFD